MSHQQIPGRIGPTAVSVATGADWALIDSLRAPLNLEVFMTDFGNSIDQSINSSYAEFQIRVNGAPYARPFDRITSQVAPANGPFRFPLPWPMGQGVLIEIYGRILTGAPMSPTLMAAQLGLQFIQPATGVPERRTA